MHHSGLPNSRPKSSTQTEKQYGEALQDSTYGTLIRARTLDATSDRLVEFCNLVAINQISAPQRTAERNYSYDAATVRTTLSSSQKERKH